MRRRAAHVSGVPVSVRGRVNRVSHAMAEPDDERAMYDTERADGAHDYKRLARSRERFDGFYYLSRLAFASFRPLLLLLADVWRQCFAEIGANTRADKVSLGALAAVLRDATVVQWWESALLQCGGVVDATAHDDTRRRLCVRAFRIAMSNQLTRLAVLTDTRWSRLSTSERIRPRDRDLLLSPTAS